jgi:hypothetical protein
MARVWRRSGNKRVHPKAIGEVVVIDIAEVPVGVSVSVYAFRPGSQLKLGQAHDGASWTVLAGSGWVNSEESDREELEPGWTTLVDAQESPTFGSDTGMTLVRVFGGWMMPEEAPAGSEG